MKMNRYFAFAANSLLLTVGAMLLPSCAKQISSDVYTSRQVGEVSVTYAGIIKNIREVCIEQNSQLEDNGLGIAGGGVAGGILGSTFGKGRFIPTAAGALAGAVSGSFIEKKLKQQSAFEYIVELDNGGLMTIVQGQDQIFNVGQPVYIIVSQTGRSRITPH